MIATDLQDVMLGSPLPIRAKVNLGVLSSDKVNIVIHGHEPILSDMIVEASRDPELVKLAQANGALGIQLSGICCTANEVLMRKGVPSAGQFLQQELAIATGAVEAMVVDVQCLMPSLPEAAKCFHTELITTSPKGRMPGVRHIEFDEKRAMEVAREIVTAGIEQFPKRKRDAVSIPQDSMDLVAGFTADYVFQLLGGRFRPSYRPLNNGIIEGRLRGVAGVVGMLQPELPTRGVGARRDGEGADPQRRTSGPNRLLGYRLRERGPAGSRGGSEVCGPAGCRRSARRSASRRCCTSAPAWTTAAF